MTLTDELKRKTRKRRIIEAVIMGGFLAILTVFTVLRTVVDRVFYLSGAVPAFIGLYVSAILLLADLIGCGIKKTVSNGEEIIVYTDLFSKQLIIGGVLQEKLIWDKLIWGRTYLEGKMKDGTRVTASYQSFNSFHLTFSDKRDPVDIYTELL